MDEQPAKSTSSWSRPPLRPRLASEEGAYDASYFTRLYGAFTSKEPSQTVLDRLRDLRIMHLLSRYAPQAPGRTLLDIGCGYGWLLQRVGSSFERYGVDISPHAIGRAQVIVPGATLLTANFEQGMPFDRRFDAALAINVLEHLHDPDATIADIFDHLMPGGVVVIHLPTIDNKMNHAIYQATYERDDTHIYRPSSKEVRSQFLAAGFQLVTHSHCPHVPAALWHALPWHPAYLAVFRRP